MCAVRGGNLAEVELAVAADLAGQQAGVCVHVTFALFALLEV
jgi:hypothetical protein